MFFQKIIENLNVTCVLYSSKSARHQSGPGRGPQRAYNFLIFCETLMPISYTVNITQPKLAKCNICVRVQCQICLGA